MSTTRPPGRHRSRRSPLAVCLALLAAILLAGCAASGGGTGSDAAGSRTVTITDMLGRKVTLPATIHRVVALHPIPTGLLSLLAPRQLVSVDSVFEPELTKDAAQWTPAELASLKSLPVTGVYFKGLNTEQLLKLHPDVVITMVGDPNIDAEQKQTGIPFFAVSKAPTASYETTIRLVGQIVGRRARADQLADFWANTIASVRKRTAALPAGGRPTVMYTGQNGNLLDTPGRNTVFGSTIDTAGGRNVGDLLPAADASTEANPVSMEQVEKWNPDVIIAASTAVKEKIMTSPQWHTLKAVRTGRVYVPRAFAGLDGLQAVLGMVWTQGVVSDGNDAAAQARLTQVTQSYYRLFYGHTLTAAQIAEQATS